MAEYDPINTTAGIETESHDVYINELDQVTEIGDDALFIVQGLNTPNTSTISLADLRRNFISDDDQPSDTKVYSSEKIVELIENGQAEIIQQLGETNLLVVHIKENYAKKDDVNVELDDIRDNMFTQQDKENIEGSLATKREKDTPITSNDLDKSSDASRIHLDNLGEDVLEAITGQTAVSLVKAPQGGWTSESYANGSITNEKLSNSYRYRGILVDGTIDAITVDGIYVLGPQVLGVPLFNDEDEDPKYMEVTSYGKNREFIEQRIDYIYQVEGRPYYIRKGKHLNLSGMPFVRHYTVTDKFKINSSLIGENITDRPDITEGNIFDYTAEGTYKVYPGVDNMPTNNDTYFVRVSKYGDYHVYEAKLNSINSCVIYHTYVHQNEYGITIATDWFKTTNSNKSKFDNQKIHIFGDGIAYGYGVNDSTKDSNYTQLLFSKYGFRVFNHALNDATIGNYNVKTIEERSVLTQIQNTTFEENDLVIVFAGTNDFKNGSCPIGNNADMKDTTFKGSLNLTIKAIMDKNPSSRLLLITPLYRDRIDSGDKRNSDVTQINARYLNDYSNAIIDIAKLNHIPVLDMMNEGLVNKYNCSHWLTDGLYFNTKGHDMFATMLFNRLNSLY
ncbi:MAG: SGNH/GDSL hydrolase family protein [Candidatus Izemoplasmatales bacterium]|nr:SGNH/GDSL hydrolase family protein [Candidatus Izemoplasmatales bacterium]